MVDENYNNFTTTSSNKGFYDPKQPENRRKEREKGKGARARGKKDWPAAVFCFYIVDFRHSF